MRFEATGQAHDNATPQKSGLGSHFSQPCYSFPAEVGDREDHAAMMPVCETGQVTAIKPTTFEQLSPQAGALA
jgi:hypothetical protein